MPYPRRTFIAALIVFALPSITLGQTPNQSAEILPFVRTNPLLTTLNQVAPESTRPVILRLERIGRSQQSTLRAPGDPTPAEQARLSQLDDTPLDANSPFAEMFANKMLVRCP